MSLPAKTAEATTWEETLLQNLYRLIQAVRIHQDNNQLVKVCVERFRETDLQTEAGDRAEALDLRRSVLRSDGKAPLPEGTG